MGPYEGVGAVSVRGRGQIEIIEGSVRSTVRGRGQSRLSRDPYVVPYEGVGSIEIIEGSYKILFFRQKRKFAIGDGTHFR